jgi:glycerate-2-kinase
MFEPGVLAADPDARRPLLAVLAAAIEAVDPRRAVAAAVGRGDRYLSFGSADVPIPTGRVVVLGLGKAAAAMARGLADALPDLQLTGVIATPVPGEAPPGLEVVRGAHPVPDAASASAGNALLRAAAGAGADDLVVALVSGGGSACAEVPAPGLGIDDIARATEALLASGAPIGEVNVVRRRLSLLKGGGLARAAAPAAVVTLVLSDVVGNDLPTIAGGPTIPDPNGIDVALGVLRSRDLRIDLPPKVPKCLRGAPSGGGFDRGPVVLVGDGSRAAEGARAAADRLGIRAHIVETALEGEAREVGRHLAGDGRAAPGPGMLVHAGETTVTVTGEGTGGRNQEVALAAGIELEGTAGILVASVGTDGIDGPTDAAGAVGDGGTVARGRSVGLEARRSLAANDSHSYLTATGDVLVTGPTGTNVGDVMVVYRTG